MKTKVETFRFEESLCGHFMSSVKAFQNIAAEYEKESVDFIPDMGEL